MPQCHSFPLTRFLNVTEPVTIQLPSSISGGCSVSNPSSVGWTNLDISPFCSLLDEPSFTTAPIGVVGNSILPIRVTARTEYRGDLLPLSIMGVSRLLTGNVKRATIG